MKKGNNIIKIVAIVIVVVLLLIVGGIGRYNSTQKNILVQEVNRIVKKGDLTVDTIKVDDIKSSGKYAEVEKAIKSYLNNYAIEVQSLIDISKDNKISNLLSISNYKEDGPEFNETLAYIEETTKKLNESSEKAIKLMEKDEMYKYIDNYDLNEKYKELYRTLMLDEETEKDLQEAKTQLQKSVDTLKNNLQVATEILNFLKENKNEWQIKSGLIMFNNQTLLNKYNEYTKKLVK